jgi:Asp-tRNA(Asn)/Glu-tRNA(Gln) amidotransferase A subunit family amidase
MRSTGGGDAAYDIDFPARDHTLVAKLREKGAIIFAKANSTEYNGRAQWDAAPHKPDKVLPSVLGYQRSTWAGTPVNVYDPTRSASLGSSSGSGTSVSANLCMASLGEETRASCRGPANHNAVCLILPHKAMLSFHGGAIGSDIYCDRAGILAKTLADCATILDALVEDGDYYDPRDPFTTVPRPTVKRCYSESVGTGSLEGVRIGVIRESMLPLPDTRATEPISTAAARELKEVLAGRLGATLVESSDPLWTLDPECEQMTVDFRRALARLVPVFAPALLLRLGEVPEAMAPIDYLVGVADERIAPPDALNIWTVQKEETSLMFRYHIAQYLQRRAADWRERGFEETLDSFAQLNARSKFWGDDQRARFKSWEEVTDPRNDGPRQGIDERIVLRELLRRVDMMVMLENKLDALVRLHTQVPPGKIGGALEPGMQSKTKGESQYGPNAGLTEVLVPAGYVHVAYDAELRLSDDRKRYVGAPSEVGTELAAPGLPFSFVFRAEPGREDVVLRIASAYEAATKHRVEPPAFARVPTAVG